MVITVLPGVDRLAVLEQLRRQRETAEALSVAEDARRWVFAYLKWASSAAGALSGLVAREDVNELVLTRRYELPVGSAAGLAVLATDYDNDPEAVASDALVDLVCIEVNDRIAVFDTAIADLEQRIDRWRAGTHCVVLDTNVYLEHRDSVPVLDWSGIVPAVGASIRVLVPMIVIDELDGAKRFSDHRRGRAVLALRMIDNAVRGNGVLRARDLDAVAAGGAGLVSGPVSLEVLGEARDHVRLPNADAEIVDCALAVHTVAAEPVTLVTFDTAMALRACGAGLNDRLLDDDQRAQERPARR